MNPQPGTTIRVTENGPYLVEGGLEVRDTRGEVLDTPGRYALCRCGASADKPFCDRTHKRSGFDGTETAPTDTYGERATVYQGTGVVPVARADGAPFETRNRMTLCRCGGSSNKPLCDGTHKKIGFSDRGA